MEGGKWPQSDFVIVNMDGSRHPLPLTTVYHNLQPVSASPYTFLQALFGHEYPVSLKTITGILDLTKKKINHFILKLKDPLFLLLELHIFRF